MATLINKSQITAKTAETVIEQVIDFLRWDGLNAEEETIHAYECKEGFGEDEYTSHEAQRFTVYGEMNGDWQTTITVKVFENRSLITDEYFYTVKAFED